MNAIQKWIIASLVMTFFVRASQEEQSLTDEQLLTQAILLLKFPQIVDRQKSNLLRPFQFELTKNQRNSMNYVMKLMLENSSGAGFTYSRGFYVGHVYTGTPLEGYHACFIPSLGQSDKEDPKTKYEKLSHLYQQLSNQEAYEHGDEACRTKSGVVYLPVEKGDSLCTEL